MVTDTVGAPRFVPTGGGPESDSDDVYWDDQFGFPGTDGVVWAIVSDGNGNVYIGGAFTTIGSLAVNGIAKWDGSSWTALKGGLGVGGAVYALAAAGSDLYAGGTFSAVGGITARNVAKWDGISWSALGSGAANDVYALATSGSMVYAGGGFTAAGGVAANYIAEWNGTSWSALGTGVDATVNALVVKEGDLYVGGWFSVAGGGGANRVARWDGTSWFPLGSGIGSSPVYALTVHGGDLYVGGEFTTEGVRVRTTSPNGTESRASPLGTGASQAVPDPWSGPERPSCRGALYWRGRGKCTVHRLLGRLQVVYARQRHQWSGLCTGCQRRRCIRGRTVFGSWRQCRVRNCQVRRVRVGFADG